MQNFTGSPLGLFRLVSILEGISYLLLLFVAMPLKYLMKIDWAVKYVGWAHGLLFVVFCFLLLNVWVKFRWSFGRAIVAFISSLLPFGTFILERKLKKEYPSDRATGF
ncbi:MAG: DUF3817 domain-containing protein [Gloeobacteraceae cyanobacterium ES-bin-316]|nr:DUF3817 domain-containing protein [Ferruginibacter sp.]